jgi:FtsP/CotA-like multicopper oxidase with cupredoxin domain
MNRSERSIASTVSAAVAVFSLLVAIVAVIVANRDSGGGSAAAGGASSEIDIALTEFAITPKAITGPPGPVRLRVTNNGSIEHNLEVKGVKASPNIKPGQSYTFDLGEMKAGEFTLLCNIAGHEAAGMVGSFTVAEGATAGEAAGGGTTGGSSNNLNDGMNGMTNEEMDKQMEDVAKKFLQYNGLAEPKLTSQGVGNQPLEPKILPDGTKQFDLTAKIVDWEIEQGTFVKAWTYNGQVPGPIMRANVGDKLKIVLKNDLPQSTSLHLHGVRVPNAFDGVDPYTQSAIKPGESFTYEFTALEPSVGMYHSHHNAQVQIPNGLAGALLIGPKGGNWSSYTEKYLDLMKDVNGKLLDKNGKIEQEVVMTLNDAGNIGLSLNGKSFPLTQGYLAKVGESMLVHYYNEGLMWHPMHLHQPHGLVVARDGKLLDQPYFSDTITVGPGERFSVLYTMQDPGVWAWHCHILTHAETSQGMRYMVTAVVVGE